jgi:lipopolysaccharide transport system permease protein
MLLNLYRHRGYILRTALADVRNRYAGSAMGFVWNILQPLAQIAIFSLVFTKIMATRLADDPAHPGATPPYLLYLCSFLLPWNAFSDSIGRGTGAFIDNAVYLRKLPIPEQVFSAQTGVAASLNLCISFSLLLIVSLLIGHAPTWDWLLLPIPLALLLGLGCGIGMLLGSVNVFIRDIGQLVPIFLSLGFWSIPICYTTDVLPAWMQVALPFSPLYPFLTTIRGLFLYSELPPFWVWPAMLAWTSAAALIGGLTLRKLRPELRDVL